MSGRPSSEDLLIRSIEREIGPLSPMEKEADAPARPDSSMDTEVLQLADRLEKEAQALREKDAGIRATMLLGGVKAVAKNNPVSNIIRKVYRKVVPEADEAVIRAQAGTRREYARAGQAAAKKSRQAVEDLSVEESRELFLGGKKTNAKADLALLGLGAGVPIAAALYAGRGSGSPDVVIKKGDVEPRVDLLSDIDINRIVGDIASRQDPDLGVKITTAADEWVETLRGVAHKTVEEGRELLTKEEVQKVAFAYEKVADLIGENITGNSIVSAWETPTLEGLPEAIEKVALVGRGAGKILGLFNRRARDFRSGVKKIRTARAAEAGAKSVAETPFTKLKPGQSAAADVSAGMARREAKVHQIKFRGEHGRGPAIGTGIASMGRRALGKTKVPILTGFKSGWGAGGKASEEAAVAAAKAKAAVPSGINPVALYGGIGVGAYALGKSGSTEKPIEKKAIGLLEGIGGAAAIGGAALLGAKGLRALAYRGGGAARAAGKGWRAGAQAQHASRAETAARKAGLKLVDEGAEEAAKGTLTTGQKFLAGGIGTGALMLGSNRNKNKGPQVHVQRF